MGGGRVGDRGKLIGSELPNSDCKEVLGSQKLQAMGLEIFCYPWTIWVSPEDQGPLTRHTRPDLWDNAAATRRYLSRLLVEIRNRD